MIGKAGRADTADRPGPARHGRDVRQLPARELWPKRVLRFRRGRQTRTSAALETRLRDRRTRRPRRLSTTPPEGARAVRRDDARARPARYRSSSGLGRPDAVRVETRIAAGLRRPLESGWSTTVADRGELALARPRSCRSRSMATTAARIWRPTAPRQSGDGPGSREALGGDGRSRATSGVETSERLWRARQAVNWELFDRGTEAFTWFALEELVKAARGTGLLAGAPRGAEAERFAAEAIERPARPGRTTRPRSPPFGELRAELEKPFRESVLLPAADRRAEGRPGRRRDRPRAAGARAGATSSRSRSSTASRCSRPACGRTSASRCSARTCDTVDRVCQEIEAAVKPVRGARDVVAAPIMGKGYLEVTIDRAEGRPGTACRSRTCRPRSRRPSAGGW